jgi:hypothetical protein
MRLNAAVGITLLDLVGLRLHNADIMDCKHHD